MQVTNPTDFANDAKAIAGVKRGIATTCNVLVADVDAQLRVARRLLEKTSEPRMLAGTVIADYTITQPSSGSAGAVKSKLVAASYTALTSAITAGVQAAGGNSTMYAISVTSKSVPSLSPVTQPELSSASSVSYHLLLMLGAAVSASFM